MKIGDKVRKKSGKSFKSTFKVNTIKDITINHPVGKKAFAFEEDDSVVNMDKCELERYEIFCDMCSKGMGWVYEPISDGLLLDRKELCASDIFVLVPFVCYQCREDYEHHQ